MDKTRSFRSNLPPVALCLSRTRLGCVSGSPYFLNTAAIRSAEDFRCPDLKRVEENQVLAKAGFEVGIECFRVDLDDIRERVEEIGVGAICDRPARFAG